MKPWITPALQNLQKQLTDKIYNPLKQKKDFIRNIRL